MRVTSDGKDMTGMHHQGPMPTTFADLLRATTGVVLAPPASAVVSQRKDQATLTDAETQRFVDALTVLNQPDQTTISSYGRLVAIHSDMSHHMHNMGPGGDPTDPTGMLGQQRFLPWHRVYLYQFEQKLQSVHPEITIPYWDWTTPVEQTIPGWLQNVTPTVNIPRPGPGQVTVTRAPGTMGFDLASVVAGTVDPNLLALATVQQATDYTTFATGLESLHNLVHVWVGGQRGTMSFLDRSPADPIFWLHHANIDRLWWQWQQSPQGHGHNPTLQPPNNIMDPWRFAEADTQDITTFNYVYS